MMNGFSDCAVANGFSLLQIASHINKSVRNTRYAPIYNSDAILIENEKFCSAQVLLMSHRNNEKRMLKQRKSFHIRILQSLKFMSRRGWITVA